MWHHSCGCFQVWSVIEPQIWFWPGKYGSTARCSAFQNNCFWAAWTFLMSCFWSALFPGRRTGVGGRWSERSGSSPTASASPHGNCITSCSSNLFDLSTLYDCVWTELAKSWICVVVLQRSRPQWISSVAGSLGYLERLSGLLQQTGNQHSSCYMWPWGFQLSPDSSLSVSIWKWLIYSSFPPSFSLHHCMDISWSGCFLSSCDCRPARPADNVHTVQLPVAGCSIPEGKLCKMYGWGETKGTDTLLLSPSSDWQYGLFSETFRWAKRCRRNICIWGFNVETWNFCRYWTWRCAKGGWPAHSEQWEVQRDAQGLPPHHQHQDLCWRQEKRGSVWGESSFFSMYL